MITVVLADDHVIFREGLRTLLSFQPDIKIIGEAGDGNAALAMILAKTPDVAVIDITMPEMNGIKVVGEAKGVKTAFIILTMHGDALVASRALASGAKGYVIKDGAFDELVKAIKEVNAGRQYVSPSISIDLQSLGERPALTERETEILKLVARGKSNREMSDILFISMTTVGTHRANIMNKLNLRKATDLARYATENGLLS